MYQPQESKTNLIYPEQVSLQNKLTETNLAQVLVLKLTTISESHIEAFW